MFSLKHMVLNYLHNIHESANKFIAQYLFLTEIILKFKRAVGFTNHYFFLYLCVNFWEMLKRSDGTENGMVH